MGIIINGVGKALPKTSVSNYEISKLVDTDNEWIVARTGIESRRVAISETALELAVRAGKEATAGMEMDDFGLVIVATVTPDSLVPSMGALVKKELGMKNAVAFDLSTACSGFVYGVWTAEGILKAHGARKALVIGVERLSRILDWSDRNTCILFGDGAGAAVLEVSQEEDGILSSFMKNYDDNELVLTCGMDYRENLYSKEDKPLIPEQFIKMDGSKVFKFAGNAATEVSKKAMEMAGLSPDDIDHYVLHQANSRIISTVAKKLGQPIEKFQMSLAETGNASAASVPMALYDLLKNKDVKKGDIVLMAGFGGGLSAGAIICRWAGE